MKTKLFKYLGTENSLAGYQESYKLVLLKIIFECKDHLGFVKIIDVVKKFKEFFEKMNKNGLINDVDLGIEKIEQSSVNDVWQIIKTHPYKAIHDEGFLDIIKKRRDNKVYFLLNTELNDQLSKNDVENILELLNKKLELYFSKIDGIKQSVKQTENNAKGQIKKTISPLEKLQKRILKQFITKKFIGDIPITEEEYELLIEYFKAGYNTLISSCSHNIIDPMFATALVQIGIKNYDGNFWGHVAKALGQDRIIANQQTWIAHSFIDTLKRHNKLILDEKERVNNILMHGFVSDNYANDFFNFLFAYYRIDLDRDINRIDKDSMDSLVEIITRNDNTGRTYWLVKQTADAVRANTRGCKIRIRRLLKLIDKRFWENISPINSANRITRLFNTWQENSKEFEIEYNKYNAGGSGGGVKRFSAPFLKCYDFKLPLFKLVLPTQLVKNECAYDLHWSVYIGDSQFDINTHLYQAVTGYKTEEVSMELSREDLFSPIIVDLLSGENKIRTFKIKDDCIRFFDKDGDYVRDDSLPRAEVYSFTKAHEVVLSDALIDSIPRGDLLLSYFDLQYGDIIRLPDGKPVSIGKKIEEGLIQRGKVYKATVIDGDSNLPIYITAPSVLLRIPKTKTNGTMIKINSRNYRMFNKQTLEIKAIEFELSDRSGDIGYQINLADFSCSIDGIYEVTIDVPNDRTNRYWKFALIKGMKYEFEDSPYIFKGKGTISFGENVNIVTAYSENVGKIKDENKFNFTILPNETDILFDVAVKNAILKLCFELPVLNWSFDDGEWQIEKPLELWHSNFPTKISFAFPEDKIRLSMDEQIDNDDSDEEQSMEFVKSKEKGIFQCDVTRFKSWLSREQSMRTVYIDLPSKHIPFFNVVTRSVVISSTIKGDFDNYELVGEFDIIGQATYYADIEFNNKVVAEKVILEEGTIRIPSELNSGNYKVTLFEDEEDDTGFGEQNYLPLAEYYCELLNPQDLQGKTIKIKHIKKNEDNQFAMQLNCDYKICGLARSSDNSNKYQGKMVVEGTFGNTIATFPASIEFYDLNKLKYAYVTFLDTQYNEDDFLLYDNERYHIVKEEQKNLPSAVKYRRYEVLYPEDYVFEVMFINSTSGYVRKNETLSQLSIGTKVILGEKQTASNLKAKVGVKSIMPQPTIVEMPPEKEEINQEYSNTETDILDTFICNTGIAPIIYNCLKNSKFLTLRDLKALVETKGVKSLNNINMLNANMKNEVIIMLRNYKVI